MTASTILSKDYSAVLEDIKQRIARSQIKAALSVNKEMIKLYWEVGKTVFEKQQQQGWGSKVIEKLSSDLKKSFPSMKGFSVRNLKYMLKFARIYPNFEIVQQVAAQIPWFHNVVLLERVKDEKARVWYIKKTIENGWSRAMLSHWIDCNLYQREGKAINNFQSTLPSPQSDLAKQTLKDPFCFDFLTLSKDYKEKELEDQLVNHIQKFLVELGQGFAFLGSQFRLQCKGHEYLLDLVFYHTKLYRYFIIELKNTPFKAEYAGKMNLYLSLVDDFLKSPKDEATIGLILCRGKNSFEAEYALRGINRPIGISHFETELVKSLPKNLSSSLPSIDEIENELNTLSLIEKKVKEESKK